MESLEPSENKVTINFWLLTIFFTAILVSAGLGVFYLTRANFAVKAKIIENKEAARPANLEAIVIRDKNCPECFDVTPLIASLASLNVKLTTQRDLDQADAEAKTLIAKYSIEKLPTLILRGEIQKNADLATTLSRAGSVDRDTFVLRQIGGPYIATATGEVKGKIELALIADTSCQSCYDVRQHQKILAQFGLNPRVTVLDISSSEAKSLINKYKITLIPTFILTGEVAEYPALTEIWPQVGIVKNDAYVFTQGVTIMGVYKDLKTGKIINPEQIAKQSSTTTLQN